MINATAAALLAFTVISGTTTDKLGHRIGGISSLRWDAHRQELVALADRGPLDGTVEYSPRFHTFAVDFDGKDLRLTLKKTVAFTDAKGEPFSGRVETGRTRIDSEGLAIAPDGTLYVADEYGPYVYHFDRDGRMIGRLDPPDKYLPGERKGRVDNQGFEGLCITGDNRHLAALLQSPLSQDGGRERGAKNRMVLYDLAVATAPPTEYLVDMPVVRYMPKEWKMEPTELGLNECEGLSDSSFLILERDGRGLGADPGVNPAATYKMIVRARFERGVLIKEPYIDLVEVLGKAGFAPEAIPVKFESLAWGGPVSGPRLLWTAVDNDFDPDAPTYFFLLSAP
ncbi:MAG: esterase-like activity of phytase family protein [Elusimicrobiota bacterium]